MALGSDTAAALCMTGNEEMLLARRLSPVAKLPARGSTGAAGFDLAAAEATVVKARGHAIAKTGLSIAIPPGTYARIAPRSGLAAKHMIHAGAGVVDADYRGEVGVVLFNHGDADFFVEVGDRVAQLILERISTVNCIEVDSLDATERGANGFGSTGVAATVASDVASLPSALECKVGELRVQRLVDAATLPKRASIEAAGFDLAAAEDVVVKANGKAIVKTGLRIAIPENTYARIAPRSGLAVKHLINVGAGVVDFDYRGEVGVVLFNHGQEDFAVAVGDRIAQLILQKVLMAPCIKVEELDTTTRGASGFGSTGVRNAPLPERQASGEACRKMSKKSGGEIMQVKFLCETATLPLRGSQGAAGFDLAASQAAIVKAHGKAIVKTGLSIAIPEGTYARIAPRSGLAAKRMINVGAGVVDFDYRGEVGVVLFNHGTEDFQVEVGDRIAQLILEQISMDASAHEVADLSSTDRGAGGFGSTGVGNATQLPSDLPAASALGSPPSEGKLPDEMLLPSAPKTLEAGA